MNLIVKLTSTMVRMHEDEEKYFLDAAAYIMFDRMARSRGENPTGVLQTGSELGESESDSGRDLENATASCLTA